MKKEKKLLALLLTFVLCIGMLPTSAFAMDFTSGNVSSYDGNAAVFDDGTAGGAGQTVQTPTPAPETQTTPAAENEEPNVEEITVEEETPGEEVTPGEEEIPTEETTPADDSIIVEEPETTEPTPTPETTPAEEDIVDDFTSQEGDSVVVEEPEAPAEPVMVARNSVMLMDVNDSEQVTVSVEGVEGTPTKDITLGVLDSNNPSLAIAGYDFLRAQIGIGDDYTIITGLYQIEDSKEYYATIEGNTTTGMRLSKTTDVVLVYETYKETYSVTYKVRVGDTTYSQDFDSIVMVTGASKVKSGNILEFAAVVQDGYKIEEVYASPTAQINAADTRYLRVSNISANTEIWLVLKEVTTYELSFNGSNTYMTYDNDQRPSHAQDGGGNETWKYTADKTLTFTLEGRNEWNSKTETKILNQLLITIDGSSVAAEIPDERGSSKTTVIAKNYEVTVYKVSNGTYPEYRVTISNPVSGGKVRGNIHVQTNYKDYNSSEVWAKQLDGVYPLAYTKIVEGEHFWEEDKKQTITEDTGGDQDRRLTPEVYSYYSRDREQDSTYYIMVKDGYNAEDLYLTVLNYSVTRAGRDPELQDPIISETRLVDLPKADPNTADKEHRDEIELYDYQFVIPKDEEGRLPWDKGTEYDDIRIYIQYKPQPDTEYTIKYDLDGGSGEIKDNGRYKANNSAVISETIPQKEDYVFEGWTLGNDSETLYDSGQLFVLTDENLLKANENREFVFKAKWIEASKAKYANYHVEIFFQNDKFEYPITTDIETLEKGRIGSRAYVIPSELEEFLDEKKPGWDNEYEYDKQVTDVPIAANGSTVLKIYYKWKAFKVYHTGVEGGNIETVKMCDLTNGTYDLTQHLTPNTLYGGYYLEYSNADTGVAYDGTNATWTKPQTENGKAMHPVCGETYYVKEVPASYMVPVQINTYNHVKDYLRDIILVTCVDDNMYKQAGFLIGTNDYQTGGSLKETIQISYGANSDFENPNGENGAHTEIYDVSDVSDNTGGLLVDYEYFSVSATNNVLDYTSILGKNIIVKSYWVTPDGLTVTGKNTRRISAKDKNNNSIIDYDKENSYGELTVMNLITGTKIAYIETLNKKENGSVE